MDTFIDQVISRQQLIGYGVSQYHARVLTRELDILGKSSNRSNLYAIPDVVQSLRLYLDKPRLKSRSREQLKHLLEKLLQLLGNVIHLPLVRGEVSEIGQMTKQLMRSMTQTDQALGKLKAQAASIRGKYRK